MDRIDYEDYSHPEKLYTGLVLVDPGMDPSKLEEIGLQRSPELKGRFHNREEGEDEKELCWNCGWAVKNELLSSYGSRVRIVHTRRNIGIWQIGSKWMIRDQPNDHSLGNDFITQTFLRHQPGHSIPILKEMRLLSDPNDRVCLTLMSRAQGVGLDTIWDDLSEEQKTSYRHQMRDILKQMRNFTSPVCAKVNGDLMDDGTVGECLRRTSPTCHKMGRTNDEWFENLSSELRFGLSRIHDTKDPVVIEEKFQELKRTFPSSEPYVLTHADLNFTNIIVKDNKIEAIIDWEFAGFMPWWVERWFTVVGGTDQTDELFKPIWEELEGDYETFKTNVVKPVHKAHGTYQMSISDQYMSHNNNRNRWLRPGFCKCQPYAGYFENVLTGEKLEHVTHFDT
ncbi:hypothetical protein ONS95_009165 [Cadophora gregata]|uniref:uncharacterized protein n=1 Tax=Cadophora gregata TaxID=51156 RepID=UPI0026DD51C4|nr:uncharacterized protein ONS95_009165 [Cadophora gregata]KAK0124183.1 hypothetical protein ONS95_009165 [Cadophora gregata]